MNPSAVTLHFRSLSQLVVDSQRPYRVVEEAVEALGIKPAVTLDGTRYFASDVADAIRAYKPRRPGRALRPDARPEAMAAR